MSTLGDLIGDSHTISRMTDQQFSKYWSSLGIVVRIASHAAPHPGQPNPARTEINNTAATTSATWKQTVQAPASAFGFARPSDAR